MTLRRYRLQLPCHASPSDVARLHQSCGSAALAIDLLEGELREAVQQLSGIAAMLQRRGITQFDVTTLGTWFEMEESVADLHEQMGLIVRDDPGPVLEHGLPVSTAGESQAWYYYTRYGEDEFD